MKKLILLGTVFFSFTVYSQKSFTLEEAIKFGKENNASVRIAAYDLQIAEKRVKETIGMGLPQVSGEINYSNFIDIPVQVAPGAAFGQPDVEFMELQFGTEQNSSVSVSASQLIFDGSYLIGLKAASVYVQLAKDKESLSHVNLKYDITNAYQLVVLSKENLLIIEKSLVKINQAFEETKAMFESGFVSESSVDELELTKLSLENALISAKNQIKTSKLLLNLQLGLAASEEVEVTTSLEELMKNEVLIGEFSAQKNISYQMLETQYDLQSLDLKNKQVKRLPSIGAFYNYQKSAYRNEFSFFDTNLKWYPTNVVGLKVNVPIFDSGIRQSRINQSKLELEKTTLQKESLNTGLTLQYHQALNDLSDAQKSLDLINRKMILGTSILDKAFENHKEGLISSFELNQKETSFLQLQGEYLKATMSLLKAKNDLDKLQSNN